jgi:phosphohistidine phosphatase
MRRLHVLRHVKSSWDDPSLADHDRPLARRGVSAGRRLRAWLQESDVTPDIVICSAALRARATLELVLPALGSPEIVVDDALFHASGETMLARLRTLGEDVEEALLVGHEPGLSELVLLLTNGGGALRARVAEKFPTGALATLEGEREWAALEPGSMQLVGLVLPREL